MFHGKKDQHRYPAKTEAPTAALVVAFLLCGSALADCADSPNQGTAVRCLEKKIAELSSLLASERAKSAAMPRSAVVAFELPNCPAGWNEYKKAYGRFVRGVDKSNAGIDPDGERGIGGLQTDELKQHAHDAAMEIGAEPIEGAAKADEAAGAHGRIGVNYTSKQMIRPSGGQETRPKNVALLYCIKVQE